MLPSIKIFLLNIRSWNGHIAHFLAETIRPTTFCLICFTETTSNSENFRVIGSYENNWKSFDRFTSHGLAICYQTSKISLSNNFLFFHPLRRILPVLSREGDTHMLKVLIYPPPGRIETFIADLIEALHSLPVHHWTVIMDNFNIDQKFQGSISLLAALLQEFSFIQCNSIATHIQILGLFLTMTHLSNQHYRCKWKDMINPLESSRSPWSFEKSQVRRTKLHHKLNCNCQNMLKWCRKMILKKIISKKQNGIGRS